MVDRARTRPLDARILRPLLELERELAARDHGHDHALEDGTAHLVRGPHHVRLETDECELWLPTDDPGA